jgi:hypothetical protein
MSSQSPSNDTTDWGAPVIPESPVSQRGFSLASLMMLVTLVAVVFGMFSIAPGAGLLTVIALVPAGFRYAYEMRRLKSSGAATTLNQKIVVFVASLAMVVIAGVAAAIAFCAVCFGGVFAGDALAPPEQYEYLIGGALIGITVGTALGLWLFYRLMKAFTLADARTPSR